jgi:hypothetical protein
VADSIPGFAAAIIRKVAVDGEDVDEALKILATRELDDATAEGIARGCLAVLRFLYQLGQGATELDDNELRAAIERAGLTPALAEQVTRGALEALGAQP